MLQPVPDADPGSGHRRRYESQGMFHLLLGLGLLALGLAGVALPAERLGVPPAGAGPDPLLWTWRLAGVLVVLAGLAALTYRRGAVLDREARTLTLWWDCLGLRRQRVHDLAGAAVTVRPVAAAYDEGTLPEYPVELRRGAEVLLEVCRPEDRAEAEARAGELAGFLGVPLESEPAP
jgi:hypothetical protein